MCVTSMGMPCFSKPLAFQRQRSNGSVHPQPPPTQQSSLDNGHQRSPPPKSPTGQYMPPPTLQAHLQQPQPQPQPWPVTRFLTPKPVPDRLTIASSVSADISATRSTSGVSTPKSPSKSRNVARRVSNFFSNVTSSTTQLDDVDRRSQQSTTKSKKAELNRTSTKSSLLQRRSKSSLGKRNSATSGIHRVRTPSMVSDTSSIFGLSEGLAGLYALASLTAYETKLVPLIWQSCLEQNEYYCEHVLSRLFNRHPELEDMLKAPQQCPVTTSAGHRPKLDLNEDINKKCDHIMAFLNRLIMVHELDYERLSEECEQLGRSHAMYYYERGLQSYHWDAFAISLVQEYKKTNMHVDLVTDEKELQQLAWTHFTTAVVSAIKESFEDEIQRLTPGPSMTRMSDGRRESDAIHEKTAFRF